MYVWVMCSYEVCVCVCVCSCVCGCDAHTSYHTQRHICTLTCQPTPHLLPSQHTIYNTACRRWPKKWDMTHQQDTLRHCASAAAKIQHTVPHSRCLHTCAPARVHTAKARMPQAA